MTSSQEIDDKWLTPSQRGREFEYGNEIEFNQQNMDNIIRMISSQEITAYTIYGEMAGGNLSIFIRFFTG